MKPGIPSSSPLAGSPAQPDGNAAQGRPKVSVMIPARNEEANIGRCLRSILAQQGIAFQVIVVDDHSVDRTVEIARQVVREFTAQSATGRPLVMVTEARRPLPEGWTGKANALFSGVPQAVGDWLLFTDADTEHAPGSLAAVVQEAEQYGADMLSLSPEQEVEGFWERSLMPVVFSELAVTFRPQEVSDPTKPAAAANGQYLLIRRNVYEEIGGHAAVAGDLLEDVALARRVKSAGHILRFRLGKGMVRTRMYRGLRQMREGWTKNLALLFPETKSLAYRRLAEFAVLVAMPLATASAWLAKPGAPRWLTLTATAMAWGNFLLRVRKAHFDGLSTALSFCGLPLFAALLLRSERAHRDGRVLWKGRNYCVSPASAKIEEHVGR
jgi:glycosyltransferase involved in cell wall biosynthesis